MFSRVEKRSANGDPCRVFEGWLCFETFKDWSLRNGWKEGMELCRNNDTGDYHPENVKWGTKSANRQEAHAKNWLVTDPEGTGHHVLSLNAFCKKNGLNKSRLYNSSKTGETTKCGWKVALLNNASRKY